MSDLNNPTEFQKYFDDLTEAEFRSLIEKNADEIYDELSPTLRARCVRSFYNMADPVDQFKMVDLVLKVLERKFNESRYQI